VQAQTSDWIEDSTPVIRRQRDHHCLITYNTDGSKDEELFNADAEARGAAGPMVRWSTDRLGREGRGQFGFDESTGQRYRLAVDWITSTLYVPTGHHIERHFTPIGWFIARVVADG